MILGSIASVVPGVEAVQEYKDAFEQAAADAEVVEPDDSQDAGGLRVRSGTFKL